MRRFCGDRHLRSKALSSLLDTVVQYLGDPTTGKRLRNCRAESCRRGGVVPHGLFHLFAPTELPCGVVTAAVGAPYFLYLLVRRHQRSLTSASGGE
nr:iron chelate uptake ABC transporter family permease subunit [Chroococcidiopsis sp. [FACHB-1243]]